MINIALTYSDGSISIMQFYGDDDDAAIVRAISKHKQQPDTWQRITQQQADEIRAQRNKSEAPVSEPKAEVDLTAILERLSAVEQNANEAKQQSSTSLKIIDAIAKSAENVAEGRV